MKTLVDTSVWIDHFRTGNAELVECLANRSVAVHPFVLGELACGNLKNREAILESLNSLPRVTSASHDEVLLLIDERKLWGSGIGWMDAHLLASVLISYGSLWTLDKRLHEAARALGVELHR